MLVLDIGQEEILRPASAGQTFWSVLSNWVGTARHGDAGGGRRL
jgi:hypothetical protein